MQIDLTRFQDTFFEEATEHVASLEAGLLALESDGADPERLATIFRAAHSIKGGAGSFGFTEVAGFTHALENVLDRLREGRLTPSPPLVRLLLRASDALGALLAATRESRPGQVDVAELVRELEGVLGDGTHESAATPPGGTAAPTAAGAWRIAFRPDPTFFHQGQDALLCLDELHGLGVVRDLRCHDELPDLDLLEPETCYLRWEFTLEAAVPIERVREAFLFVEDACDLSIQPAEAGRPAGGAAATGAAGGERRRDGERRVDSGTLRVPTAKVDSLINLVGELVIAQAMAMQTASQTAGDPALEEALAIVQRSTRELQEQVMGIRMLPVGTVFHRFSRIVHDLGGQLGKQVRLDISGAETELDKGVLEQLGDPLVHLIRNSVDHGLERPAERAAAGKPEEGVVSLRAYHEGGSVVIEVEDDGHGLDAARIRAKAVERGLVRADAMLTEAEIHELVFQAGFSTAHVVSDVSGRGVGMDVVKRNVESLNGTIHVSSRAGAGSRFRIRLPLTLAILDGLLVQLAGETLILPLLAIRQSLRPTPGDVKTLLGGRGEVFVLRGEQLPLVRLARQLATRDAVEDPTRGIVVVTENDGERFGILVDDVIGQQQVVVKSLEKNFRKVQCVMGATILGNGRVAFIVDVAELHGVATRRRTGAEDNAPDEPLGVPAGAVTGEAA